MKEKDAFKCENSGNITIDVNTKWIPKEQEKMHGTIQSKTIKLTIY